MKTEPKPGLQLYLLVEMGIFFTSTRYRPLNELEGLAPPSLPYYA